MKNFIYFFALCCFSSLLSCNSGPSSGEVEQQQLWDEMMVIHDEVMPAMGDIFKYNKALKPYLDSTAVDAALKAEIRTAMKNLDNADDGMMDWMAELKQPKELMKTLNQKEVLEYLKAETEKIKVVKQQMEESLAEGEKLVRKLTLVEIEQ